MSDFGNYADMLLQQTALNNSWSAEQAQKQMEFQERMSSTAHQREVADLKAAGLNPVLSANSGASSPTGAAAQADTSIVPALADIAMTLAKADNARAIASMRSSAGYYGYKDPMQDTIWQFLLEATGNGGKTAQQVASDAVSNFKDLYGNAKTAVSGAVASVSNALNKIFNSNSAKSTKHYSGKFEENKSYSNGTQFRVSSNGRNSLR